MKAGSLALVLPSGVIHGEQATLDNHGSVGGIQDLAGARPF
jgi:hypothetical protein